MDSPKWSDVLDDPQSADAIPTNQELFLLLRQIRWDYKRRLEKLENGGSND